MTEHPILFSGEMVLAILEGRKTQTRRIIKDRCWLVANELDDSGWPVFEDNDEPSKWVRLRCPYGNIRDRLWVREKWALVPAAAYPRSDDVKQILSPANLRMAAVHAAGWERFERERWRPSIHMPRWASRITLEITDARAERLRDISETDCISEGCATRRAYQATWETIYGEKSWKANPCVWVVGFKRI